MNKRHPDKPEDLHDEANENSSEGSSPSGLSAIRSSRKRLQESNFEDLVDSLPLSLVFKDREGKRVFVNRHYLNLHKTTLRKVLGKTDAELFPPHIARKFAEDDRRVLEEGEVLHSVERLPALDGKNRWIERIKGPALDREGKIIGVQLLFWDVSERMDAEEAYARERSLLHTLLDNIPDSIYFKDAKSCFLRVSQSMAEKFGFPSPELLTGKSDADIFTEEHAAQARADEIQIMRDGVPLVGRIEKETWPHKDPTWCSTTKMPLRDQDGIIVGTFGISRDITELKKIQDELRGARDAATAANRAKSEFLANMSHEIRTPMNGIIGMAELLARTQLSEQQREFLGMIRSSADSLLRLLNDILDFSKIEAGRLELENVPFDLADCVSKTVQMLGIRVGDKPVELACRVDPNMPQWYIGDPLRIRQILTNLVGNSIKFTDRGEIFVEVEQAGNGPVEEERDGSKQEVRELLFRVRDTGIGIPEARRSAIFGAFDQADTSTTRRFGGTGLGLAISKQLTLMMGGKIWVESEVGRGSTFHFTIRLPVSQPKTEAPHKLVRSLDGIQALIVDDNETNRRVLEELLVSWNLIPHSVASGQEALDTIHRAADDGAPFQLILLDLMMPDMDGMMLARRICNVPDAGDPIMIMLSSAARPGDLDKCREVGIRRYLTKPVVQSDLLNVMLHELNPEALKSAEIQIPVEVKPAERTLEILLVEDGVVNQQVAIGLLKGAGHRVVLAENGEQALHKFEPGKFDAILMDLQMPVMDGFEATEKIREAEAGTGTRTPIVAMTAAAMDEDRQRCFDCGMDGHIAKPVDPSQLLVILDELSEEGKAAPNRRKPGSGDVRAGDPRGSGDHDKGKRPAGRSTKREDQDEASRSTEPEEAGKLSDMAALLKRFRGRTEVAKQLIGALSIEAPQLFREMKEALQHDDARRLQRAAHTLKGAVTVFGAHQVRTKAEELEMIGRSGKLHGAAGLAKELQQLAEKLLDELHEEEKKFTK